MIRLAEEGFKRLGSDNATKTEYQTDRHTEVKA